VLPAEISAAAVLVSYWTPAGEVNSTCTAGICNNALWVALMLLIVVSTMSKHSYRAIVSIDLITVGSQCGWDSILRRDGVLVLFNQGNTHSCPSFVWNIIMTHSLGHYNRWSYHHRCSYHCRRWSESWINWVQILEWNWRICTIWRHR
jgi:amino acid transporter